MGPGLGVIQTVFPPNSRAKRAPTLLATNTITHFIGKTKNLNKKERTEEF